MVRKQQQVGVSNDFFTERQEDKEISQDKESLLNNTVDLRTFSEDEEK